jgi:SulP family sulfate permease
MAQGLANFVAPLFGGLPATGTIARTVTNVRAGGSSPVAGIVHAAALMVILALAAPLAAHVPLAALAGILMVVAWNMGEWHEFARLRRFNPTYRTLLLGTFRGRRGGSGAVLRLLRLAHEPALQRAACRR